MPPVWLQLFALALQGAPAVMSEVESALNDHWGKDHTQQVVKGAQYLAQLASTVSAVASSLPPPVTEPAPPAKPAA